MIASAILAQALVQAEPYLRARGDVLAAMAARDGWTAAALGDVSRVQFAARQCWFSARHMMRAAIAFGDEPEEASGYRSEAESLLGLASFLRSGAAAMEAT